jgi:hypothetical protein
MILRDGEPCNHPGCLSHISHPCEGCGRTAGVGVYEPRTDSSESSLKWRLVWGPVEIDPNLEPFPITGHWEGNTFVPDTE